MKENKRLCVAYSCDDHYAKYLGISMLSLLQTNRENVQIQVFILDCGIMDTNRKKLEDIASEYVCSLHFVSMEKVVAGLDLRMGIRKMPVASYARLFLSTVIPELYDRIIYLDCDTIIRAPLNDFWNTNLDGYMVAGVQDTIDSFFVKKIGLKLDEYYINAGILLINLAGWRENHMEEQFINFIQKFDGNVPFHDQGTINGVCVKKKKIIPLRYNAISNIYSFSAKTIKRIYFLNSYYSQKELEEARKNPAIIHFTTGLVGRPWEENCSHPMKEEYLKIARISPWKDDPILPDSRKFMVKAFAAFYKHMPLLLTETVYRTISELSHLRER